MHEWFPSDRSYTKNATRGFIFTKELLLTGAVNGLLWVWDRKIELPRFDFRPQDAGVLFMDQGAIKLPL
jgi:hypothetical protein